jgi:hypothetical protein
MIRTQIQLTAEQAAYLKQQAGAQNVSMAELIRTSVAAFMHAAHAVSPADVRRRARAAAGKVHSGRHDLSTRHDDAFAEAAQ